MDLHSIFLGFLITDFLSMAFIVVLWYQNRSRYNGLEWIMADYVLHFTCITLIFFRGIIPDFASIVLSNTLAILGGFLGIKGFAAFLGRKISPLFSYIYLPLFFVVQAYFCCFHSDLGMRNLNIAAAYLFVSVLSAVILFYPHPRTLRSFSRNTGIVFLMFATVNLVRVAYFFNSESHPDQAYFHSGTFEVFIAVSYQFVLLLLAFMIILMVNKRLIHDIMNEEQKMSVAYRAVPNAIVITRKRDGVVIDVNDGFECLSGYSKAEVLGHTSAEMHFWVSQEERETLLNELEKNKFVRNLEFNFQIKSGKKVVGQISAIRVQIEEEDCTLLVIDDITERINREIEISKSRDILKKLVVNLHTEHEIERINLASLIDNQLNQSLAVLRMNIGALKRGLRSGNAVTEELVKLVDDTYQQTGTTIERSLALMNNMRNEVLYLLGLVEAMNYSIEEIEKTSEILCSLHCEHSKIDADPQKASVIFSAFQELVNQILQVGNAQVLDIGLDKREGILYFSLGEDGNSFEAYFDDSRHGMALISELTEKLTLFNGTFRICKKGSRKTMITIEMADSENRIG